MSAPVFSNHGCRLNAYETEAMKDLAASAGLEDAVIVNTCAVTSEAVRKARQDIRKLRRDNPDARIEITLSTGPTTIYVEDKIDAKKDVTIVPLPFGEADARYVTFRVADPTALDRLRDADRPVIARVDDDATVLDLVRGVRLSELRIDEPVSRYDVRHGGKTLLLDFETGERRVSN